jgi:hypothetical protein
MHWILILFLNMGGTIARAEDGAVGHTPQPSTNSITSRPATGYIDQEAIDQDAFDRGLGAIMRSRIPTSFAESLNQLRRLNDLINVSSFQIKRLLCVARIQTADGVVFRRFLASANVFRGPNDQLTFTLTAPKGFGVLLGGIAMGPAVSAYHRGQKLNGEVLPFEGIDDDFSVRLYAAKNGDEPTYSLTMRTALRRPSDSGQTPPTAYVWCN